MGLSIDLDLMFFDSLSSILAQDGRNMGGADVLCHPRPRFEYRPFTGLSIGHGCFRILISHLSAGVQVLQRVCVSICTFSTWFVPQ